MIILELLGGISIIVVGIVVMFLGALGASLVPFFSGWLTVLAGFFITSNVFITQLLGITNGPETWISSSIVAVLSTWYLYHRLFGR